jgi:hypothetical protein
MALSKLTLPERAVFPSSKCSISFALGDAA